MGRSNGAGDGGGLPAQNRNREIGKEPGEDEPLKTQPEPPAQPKRAEPVAGGPDRSAAEQNQADQQPPASATGPSVRKDVTGRWGTLPPKVQEMLLFEDAKLPPKYRRLIEQCYRKAAQESSEPK